jgi:putative sterol carrier protein
MPMATKEQLFERLKKWTDLLEIEPEIADEFENFNKIFLFEFPDIGYSVKMIFENKRARLEEGTMSNPDMSLTVDSKTFYGILTGDIDPIESFMEGELQPKGSPADLQRLEIFMDYEDED